MNERLIRALLTGLRQGADAALLYLKADSALGTPVDAPMLLVNKSKLEPESASKPVPAPVETAAKPPPQPDADKPAPVQPEPEKASEPELEKAVAAGAQAIEPLAEDVIDAMTRPQLVKYFEGSGIMDTPEFTAQVGALKGKQVPTLRKFLKNFFATVDRPVSQQVPPSSEQDAVVPAKDAPSTPEVAEASKSWTLRDAYEWTSGTPVVPVEAHHPDVQADTELATQATELMAFFAKVGGGNEKEAGQMQAYFRRYGCNGVCLLHDKGSIEACVRRLTSAT